MIADEKLNITVAGKLINEFEQEMKKSEAMDI